MLDLTLLVKSGVVTAIFLCGVIKWYHLNSKGGVFVIYRSLCFVEYGGLDLFYVNFKSFTYFFINLFKGTAFSYF